MGGDPLDIVKDVTLNVATGGLYSLGTSLADTVKTGDPSHLFTQGLDIGMAATGNNLAEHLGGPNAALAFNAAGGAAGAAGAAGMFSSLPGFTEGGVAPTVLEGSTGVTGATPLTEGSETLANPNFTQAAGAKPGVGEFPATSIPGQEGATLPGESGATSPLATSPTPGNGVLSTPSVASDITPKDYGSVLSPQDSAAMKASVARINEGADLTKEATGWSPAVKSALALGGVLTAGQMATGALGGIFQGLSAQKQLALEQLINQQNQTQRLYLNKNNSFAPKLAFKQTGVLTTPK